MEETHYPCQQCGSSGKCQFDANPGNGKCGPCAGSGIHPYPNPCDQCTGTGTCKRCSGSGKCIFCNGTGKAS
jgi:hypothetical protein